MTPEHILLFRAMKRVENTKKVLSCSCGVVVIVVGVVLLLNMVLSI